MMVLGIETNQPVETPGWVPAFGRGCEEPETVRGTVFPSDASHYRCSPQLWARALELVPDDAAETIARVADVVSLRGAELVGALIERFDDVDAALACFDDYAGAFDCIEDFAEEVAAERFGTHPDMVLAPLELAGFAQNLIETGSVFIIVLAGDCHVFWRV
ncbi:MAG: hypothetical protein ACFBZ9_11285 [Sphingomonadales bacterium]